MYTLLNKCCTEQSGLAVNSAGTPAILTEFLRDFLSYTSHAGGMR